MAAGIGDFNIGGLVYWKGGVGPMDSPWDIPCLLPDMVALQDRSFILLKMNYNVCLRFLSTLMRNHRGGD